MTMSVTMQDALMGLGYFGAFIGLLIVAIRMMVSFYRLLHAVATGNPWAALAVSIEIFVIALVCSLVWVSLDTLLMTEPSVALALVLFAVGGVLIWLLGPVSKIAAKISIDDR
jgi:hypothetical protein